MGTTKLLTTGGGGVNIQPASSIASDVTVNVPSQNCTLDIQGPAFSAYSNAGQALSTNTWTKLLFQVEEYDTNNNFASSTFTPTVAGYYMMVGRVQVATSQTTVQCAIAKNGALYKVGNHVGGTVGEGVEATCLVYCNGTTDYIDCYGFFGSGQNTNNDPRYLYFQGVLVRAA